MCRRRSAYAVEKVTTVEERVLRLIEDRCPSVDQTCLGTVGEIDKGHSGESQVDRDGGRVSETWRRAPTRNAKRLSLAAHFLLCRRVSDHSGEEPARAGNGERRTGKLNNLVNQRLSGKVRGDGCRRISRSGAIGVYALAHEYPGELT